MAIELFRYYLTGRHFTVVTDHASLTWLRNFREPEGMVARWIAWLQPFDFAIVHRPGKHHSHADGLSRRTSRLCKRETCPECKPLRKEETSKIEMARCYAPAFPYQRHFAGYVEMSEEDAALFWEIDNHPTPDPGGSSTGPALADRAVPMPEETVPETLTRLSKMTPIGQLHCEDVERIPRRATSILCCPREKSCPSAMLWLWPTSTCVRWVRSKRGSTSG